MNLNKCKVLQGRKVYLFPDLSKNGHAFEKWSNKAKKLNTQLPNTKFTVSHLLELYSNNNERLEGQDIADYLIQLNWQNFQVKNSYNTPKTYTKIDVATIQQQQINKLETSEQQLCNDFTTENQHQKQYNNNLATTEQQEKWNINSLETFFHTTKLPKNIIINGINISNVSKFVKMHLNMIKANNGKHAFLPYLHRLKQLRKAL